MSIEKTMADLTVALNANTAAIQALAAAGGKTQAAAPPASTGKKDTTTPPEVKATKTRGEVNAALTDVKEKKGAPAAKAIIKDVGGVEKMVEIPEDKFDAVYKAAKKAVEEDGNDDGI